MDDLFEDIEQWTLDGGSRSSRWKNLRIKLKMLIRVADENSDRLASLEAEAIKIRETNLKLTEAIQTLSDLANEEAQREISLTLNDDDYEVVVDTLSQPVPRALSDMHPGELGEGELSVELADELMHLPGIGDKLALKIDKYFEEKGKDKKQLIASILAEIRNDGATQPTLSFGEEGERRG